uniref:YbhB/YbcL family Raf kinase inhibitor-like protein n=1 Tax=Acidithiobacillus ferrianus TaxID=2678518 RepID=A0A845UAC0_9PROT|nr:YbhB/YbcL family Raf kinase inhibitor-like protein [Acidithiobacillus ferrianus]NDU42385.1 YbhB/YbcL family Raf kinase inhibitor-like protein [Acidithiobacillus ferrianus]
MIGKLLRHIRAGTKRLAINNGCLNNVPDSLTISSMAFQENGWLPEKYTQFGENISPPLEWHNLPVGAKSIVVIIEDSDVPLPMPFVHGIAYNIADVTKHSAGLQEGDIPTMPVTMENGSQHGLSVGRNTLGKPAYIGPGPIAGHGPHHYYFQVFALDKLLPRFPGPPKHKEMIKAMTGHVLAKGCLVGVYEK